MNTTPTQNPAQQNTQLMILGGLAAGLIVLCGGMFVMAWVTLRIVDKGASGSFAASTQPVNTGSPASSARKIEDPGSEGSDAYKVAKAFLSNLRAGQIGEAYQRTSNTYKGQESQEEFRRRIDGMKGIRGGTGQILSRFTGGSDGQVDFRGAVTGPNGTARVTMTLVQEDDGWHVESFGKE